MASTYSTNLALELIGTGDQAGTWGNTTNTNLGTLVEQAISGYVTQAVTTGADTTITIPNGATGVARNMYIELTGTGGTNTNLIVPANKKLYFVYNNSTGAVTVKVSGQTGVSVPTGKKVVLACNGTDIVNAINYVPSFGTDSLSITSISATSGSVTTLAASDASSTVLRAGSGTITNLLATALTVKSSGATPTINFANSSGTVLSQAIYSTGMYLINAVSASIMYLNGYSTGGVQRSLFTGDPNGSSTMWYAGHVGVQAVNTGAVIYSSVNDNPEIGLYQDDSSTRNALIQASTSGLYLYQEAHGQPIVLISENGSGVQKTLFAGDPDSYVDLYYAGDRVFRTNNVGVLINSAADDNPNVQFYQNDVATRNGFIQAGTSAFSIVSEVAGAPMDLVSENLTCFAVSGSSGTRKVGFYGATPAAKQTVTGSKGGNAALGSLLTALSNLGLITDSTS